MLKLRSIGLSDYSVLEGRQRIGRIRLATERMPCVWLWSVTVHLPGGLPTGSSQNFSTAKAEFKAAWKALNRSLRCRVEQPTDLTHDSRKSPFSLLDTQFAAVELRIESQIG
jgi:hypothetical protein